MSVLRVWIMHPLCLERADTAELVRLLSLEEQTRYQAFVSKERQSQFLQARALLRHLLGAQLGLAPSLVELVIEPQGRPVLHPQHRGELSFSLSHTRNLIAIAIANGAPGLTLGIDVEDLRRERDCLALARRFFAETELDYLLEAASPAEQHERFMRCWTLKEAYLKATGTGIAGDLRKVGFSFKSNCRKIEFRAKPAAETLARDSDGPRGNWMFESYAVGADHILALACFAVPQSGAAAPSAFTTQWITLPKFTVTPFEAHHTWSSMR